MRAGIAAMFQLEVSNGVQGAHDHSQLGQKELRPLAARKSTD
jgi:hypothetical protein